MLSSVGQSEGLLERLLELSGASDATWLAGIAVVVGMMLWAAGARAVSLAFAAAGGTAGLFGGFTLAHELGFAHAFDVGGLPGSLIIAAVGAAIGVVIALVAMRLVVAAASGATAAAAAAGLAILLTPFLPPDMLGDSSADATATSATQATNGGSEGGIAEPSTAWQEPASEQAANGVPAADQVNTKALANHLQHAWSRVPQGVRSEAGLAVLGFGLLGAMLGAIWPSRVASATTAFLGAIIWPIGALKMQAIAGTPLSLEGVPTQTWLIAWLALGMVGLGIQRLVVRKIAEG